MITRPLRLGLTSILLSATAWAASAPADASRPAGTASRPAARGTAKGPLPDPVLLDGSTLPVEKRPEQGMIGDFELPGDENARNGRVGGPQLPPGQMPNPSGGASGGLPQLSGGAGGPPGSQPPGLPSLQTGAQASASQPANPSAQANGAGALDGAGDPNAKAEGMQVGNLQTDPNAGGQDAGGSDPGLGQKPSPVSIGDSAMQIKTVPNAPGIVGAAVPAGATQQMEKSTGGGRGSSSVSGGRNAVEKGRAIPAGL